MKLLYSIILKIFVALTLILTVWAVFFYVAMIDEVNDEVDDSLEDYSENIMIRALAGEELPTENNGSNNQYYLTKIGQNEAFRSQSIVYNDSMIYIKEKKETEPARILTTIFKDNQNNYYRLVVSTPTIEKEDLKESILSWMIFLYFALLLTIVILLSLVLNHSMNPIYKLLNWMEANRVGGKHTPLKNDTNVTEFKKLNAAVIRYAERNEQFFEQQKQFIGNASHEIQTPLAICMNRLEMLMEDEALSENQLEELVKTHGTLEYITKLNKSLLFLSKIDNGQFTENSQLVINDLVKKYLDDYKDVYEYKQIKVNVIENGILKIRMNEPLAVALLTNLLKNAYVHNVENGSIRIEIDNKRIMFSNTGGDSPLDKAHIFKRFYQGNKKEGSTGLGLAIVESICRLQHFHLDYNYSNHEHQFEISVY